MPEAADALRRRWRARVAVRLRRRWTGALGLLGAGLAITLAAPPPPLLVWNASPSAPMGLYAVLPGADLRRYDMVVAWPPAAARRLAAARGYVPAGAPLVKRVAGLDGDLVCGLGRELRIEGRLAARRRTSDGKRRVMPWWRGCGALPPDTVLLLSGAPDSFDGRYFGPIARARVIGKARLLWRR